MQKWTRKPLNGPTLTTPGQTEGHNSEKQFIINKKKFLFNFSNIFFDNILSIYMQIIYSEFHLIWSSGFRENPRTTYRESDIRLLLYRFSFLEKVA